MHPRGLIQSRRGPVLRKPPIPLLSLWVTHMTTNGSTQCHLADPVTVNIASSTNTNPVTITTATPHGMVNGQDVAIHGHLVNTAVNPTNGSGYWNSTLVDSTSFTVPVAGNGVGGATGSIITNEATTYGFSLDYDGIKVFHNIAEYTGDSSWYVCADNHKATYLIPSEADNYNVQGYRSYSEGLKKDYLRTGDVRSYNAVIGLSHAQYGSDLSSLGTQHFTLMREGSLALLNISNAEALGEAHRTRYDLLVDIMVGTGGWVEQLLAGTGKTQIDSGPLSIVSSTNASPIVVEVGSSLTDVTGERADIAGHLVNTNANGSWSITVIDSTHFSLNGSTGNGVGGATGTVEEYPYCYKPFMLGLMTYVLITCYEQRGDARIPGAVKSILDFLWQKAWTPALGISGTPRFLYIVFSDGVRSWTTTPGYAGSEADLALLNAPAWAWYYRYSKEAAYRDQGNRIWETGVQYAYLGNYKQYFQNYIFSPSYISWYRGA